MTKTQIFKNMHLHPVAIKSLDQYLTGTMFHNTPHSTNFEVPLPGRVHWCLDTFDQFLTEYPQSLEALYQRAVGPYEVHVFNSFNDREFFSEITVRARFRHTIDTIFDFIEGYRKASTIIPRVQANRADPPTPATSKPKQAASRKTSRRDRKPARRGKRPCRTSGSALATNKH